jgi:hypothetical protein
LPMVIPFPVLRGKMPRSSPARRSRWVEYPSVGRPQVPTGGGYVVTRAKDVKSRANNANTPGCAHEGIQARSLQVDQSRRDWCLASRVSWRQPDYGGGGNGAGPPAPPGAAGTGAGRGTAGGAPGSGKPAAARSCEASSRACGNGGEGVKVCGGCCK